LNKAAGERRMRQFDAGVDHRDDDFRRAGGRSPGLDGVDELEVPRDRGGLLIAGGNGPQRRRFEIVQADIGGLREFDLVRCVERRQRIDEQGRIGEGAGNANGQQARRAEALLNLGAD